MIVQAIVSDFRRRSLGNWWEEAYVWKAHTQQHATGAGTITGTMAFDRKYYGMNKGIPFVKIADRVEVRVNLKAKRVSGPPVVFKQ